MRKSSFSAGLLAGLAAAFLISVPVAFADPNLVSWWKFDEGTGYIAYDSAGSNDGTVYGATWTEGQIDGALSFDGSLDYVLVGDRGNLEQQAFTLSFWARLNNPSGSLQGGIAKGYIFGSPLEYSYKIDFDSGYVWPAITNASNTAFGMTCSIVDTNWHMWSMTAGSGTLTLYKDGVFVDSTGYTGTIDYTKNDNNFVIGARKYGDYAFNGKIDDVRFYDSVLSAGEIWQLYLGGLQLEASNPNPANGATGVDLDVILGWSPGELTVSHDVYFGTNYNDVNNADTSSPEYKGNYDVNSYDPCGLELMTTYYWRIDEVNEPNIWKGSIWSFTTGRPAIGLSATQFEFTAIEGWSNPADQILGVSNSGVGTLNWQINEDCGWLSVVPNSGSSTGEVDNVTLSVDISGLAGGVYTCNMMVSDTNASNNPQTVGVTLYVIDADDILYVPSVYPTIQAAINASVDGNIIVVAPGIYTGNGNRDIDFLGKAITVLSENGPKNCIIDCLGRSTDKHRGFIFESGENANTILDGFTITNGYIDYGGGIYCYMYSSPKIINCIISANIANTLGGGICCLYGCSPTIANCVFKGNLSGNRGGGIYSFYDSHPVITNCTIVNNSAELYGGGLYAEETGLTIKNSIVWGNVPEQITLEQSTTLTTYSDIQGGWAGTGNINADPLFVNSAGGDLHLLPGSPCIDAGSNSAVPIGIGIDPDGRDRFADGDCNDTAIVDMGAYEFTYAYFGDLDSDCYVEFIDFAVLADYWLTDELLADIAPTPAGDGVVDASDLAILCDNWLENF